MDAHQIKNSAASVLAEGRLLHYAHRDSCLRNLAFAYHAMLASEDLLCLAIERSHGELRAYFKHHLQEETGHEKWLAADLKAAGYGLGSPDQITVAMVGSVYYLVRHVDACALLGYMLVMECFPAPLEHVANMEAMHGAELFRTLRFHAEHDIDHGADVLEQIDKLSERQKSIVMDCAIQTARYMALASHTF